MINIINLNNKNYILIKSIFFRTCLFFVAAYFIFHFLNGNISLTPLEDKKMEIMNSQRILINKEKDLEFKELLISKLNNASDNIDLIDELIRIKLGYSADDEIVLSIE